MKRLDMEASIYRALKMREESLAPLQGANHWDIRTRGGVRLRRACLWLPSSCAFGAHIGFFKQPLEFVSLLPFTFALLICAMSIASAQSATRPLPPTDDTQNWNDVQFIASLNSRTDLTFNGQLRIGRHLTRPVDERGGGGLTFRIGRFVTLAPGYVYIAGQPFEGRKTYENRLTFAATVRSPPIRGFTFSDRNQFEERLRNSAANSTRYRNRFQIERPVEIKGFRLVLFASDEVFYDFTLNQWSRNRFAVGVSRRFSDRYTGDVYYLRQNDGFTRPGDLHVIGTTLRVRL